MSLNINLYKNRLDAYKVIGKDGKIDSMKNAILGDFMSNPSHYKVLVSGIDRDVHIISEGAKGNNLLCKPNENINTGEYVIWNDKDFLCTYRFTDDKVQTRGTIQMCTNVLNWIDIDDKLNTRPAIISGQTLYTTGIKDEKIIEIPNGMMGILIPHDKVTKGLARNQTFVFNKSKYRVTFYDETSFPGLISLICSETSLSDKDDMVNQIADRWVEIDGGGRVDRLPWLDDVTPDPPIEPEPDPDPAIGISYEITVEKKYSDDNDFEIWYNNWQKYHIKKLENDIEVEGNFAYELSDSKATIDEAKPNSCVVKVGGISGKHKVTLRIKDRHIGEFVLEQEINIVGR